MALRLLTQVLIMAAVPCLSLADEPISIDHDFFRRLSEYPDVVSLRDLAEAGSAGEHVGPIVVRLLDDDDWEIRLAAARTLGFIGHAGAVEPLIKRLSDPTDVRLNWIAAQSLGRLQARSAIPALKNVADSHWYPPVRIEAAAAIEHIGLRKAYEKRPSANFPFEFFAFRHIGTPDLDCSNPAIDKKTEIGDQKIYASQTPEKLQQLKITVTEARVESTRGKISGSDDDGEQPLTYRDFVTREEEVQHVPTVALRVVDGWLVGSNRGEWGGELAFRSDDGASRLLRSENVEDIHILGGRIIALTGLAHSGSNTGDVYSLHKGPTGEWSARPWRGLPGAPMSSWLTESGEVLINTANGGTVLLHPSGTFRVAPCLDP